MIQSISPTVVVADVHVFVLKKVTEYLSLRLRFYIMYMCQVNLCRKKHSSAKTRPEETEDEDKDTSPARKVWINATIAVYTNDSTYLLVWGIAI